MKKQLPENWVETELGNYAYLKNGYAFKSSDFCNIGIPVIKISNIKDGRIDLDNSMCVDQSIAKTEFSVNKGDILIAMSGATTGKFGLYNLDNVVMQNQRVGNIKPLIDELSHKKFIYYLFFDLKQDIEIMAYGGAQPNISPQLISSLRIPLPPLAEQERIAEKLDALFGQLDSVRGAMNRIPTLIANLRQQILTYAVTGKLTQEWRQGKNLEEWTVKTIKSLSSKVGSGATPKGGQEVYKLQGTPLIRSMNVRFGGIDYMGLAYIDDIQAYALRGVEVHTNDVLLNITGASIGRVCLTPKDLNGARVNQHVCIIRCIDGVKPLYMSIYLSSPKIQSLIMNENYGVTRQALTKDQILNIEVDLPSYIEQTEIANRVQSLFGKLDSIEQRYQMLKTKLENLPQAILHKAFKGELVEQLPSDGNATDLLREIEQLKKSLKKK